MKQSRFDNFSDGIFAIILTLLAFELHVPSLSGPVSEQQIIMALVDISPVIISFILSFSLIYTYWRAHHFIATVYAKNIDHRLTSINAFFFFFVCLVPFSTRLIGEYGYTKTAIWVYGMNIALISLSLIWMRWHVFSSGNIDHARVGAEELKRGHLRLLLPLISAIVAIFVSYIDTRYSFAFFVFAILFNILPGSTQMASHVIESVHDKVNDLTNSGK